MIKLSWYKTLWAFTDPRMFFNLLKQSANKTLSQIDPVGHALVKNTDPVATRIIDKERAKDQVTVVTGDSTATTPKGPNTPMEVKSRTPAGGLRDITAEAVSVPGTNPSGIGTTGDYSDPLAAQRNKF